MTNCSCLLKKNYLYVPVICHPTTAGISFRKIHLDRNAHPVFTLYWKVKVPSTFLSFNFPIPVTFHVVDVLLHCFNMPS